MSAALISLAEAGEQPPGLVGGKAAALGRLIGFGAPVPPGFVLPPTANPETNRQPILAAFDALGAEFVAVRSSAAGEDSKDQSWAGQLESYLFIPRAQLLDRIADCRNSARSARAQAYDAAKPTMPVAVIVQTMVPSDVSGVLFTVNPVTKNRDELMIEAVYGLGELLVQGLATPDNYLINKSTGHTTSQTIAQKSLMLVRDTSGLKEQVVPASHQNQPTLTPVQIAELSKLAVALETKFGHSLDIEWAYAKDKLYLVQARPITTL